MKPGSYRVSTRAIVLVRGNPPAVPPVGYVLALLTGAPAPEGGRFDEIDAPEYVRQPLQFVSSTEGGAGPTWRNANHAAFGPALAWPQATHAAILNAIGEVVAYGLIETAPGHVGAYEVTFAATAIQLRFA